MIESSAEDLLTTSQAAKIAERAPDTIRHHARTGRLRSLRLLGGQRLFRREDVLRFADQLRTALRS
jgi:excisionase family DNA binding protein